MTPPLPAENGPTKPPKSIDAEAAKMADAKATYYRETRSRRWNLMRGEGAGVTLYFGQYRGARFVSIDLRGFNGWTSSPRWMPGGWEFLNPTVSTGRLFMDASRSWSRQVLVPAKVWDIYQWKIRPSGRRYIREHGHEQPQEATT